MRTKNVLRSLIIILICVALFGTIFAGLDSWDRGWSDASQYYAGITNQKLDSSSQHAIFDRLSPNVDLYLAAGKAFCLAFSPDGSKLAVGTSVGIEVYNVSSSSLIKRYITRGKVNDLDWAADSNKLVSCTNDGSITLWNVSQSSSALIGWHDDSVLGVAISDDASVIASCGADKSVRLWQGTSSQGQILYYHDNIATCVDISPDGSNIVSGSYDNNVKLYNIESGRNTRILQHYNWVKSVKFSPNGEIVVSAGCDNRVRSFSLVTHATNSTGIHNGWAYGADFIDNQYIISGGGDKAIYVWDYTISDENIGFVGNFDAPVNAISVSRTGNKVAYILGFEKVQISDIVNNTHTGFNHYTGTIYTMGYLEDMQIAACGVNNGIIDVWNVNTGIKIESLEAHDGFVYDIASNNAGNTFASCGSDGEVIVWNASNYRQIETLDDHDAPVDVISYSRDGTLIASGSYNKVLVWNYAQDDVVNEITSNTGLSGYITALAFNNQNTLAIGTAEGTVFTCNLQNNNAIRKFSVNDSINSLKFSNNPNVLAYSTSGGEIGIYDLSESSKTVYGNVGTSVDEIGINNNGSVIVTGDDKGIITAWTAPNQSQVVNIHGSVISSISLIANGTKVVSSSLDGTIRMIDLTRPSSFGQRTGAGTSINIAEVRTGWTTELNYEIRSIPVVDDNNIYIVNFSSAVGSLDAINTEAGNVVWTFSTPDQSKIYSTPAQDSDKVYVSTMNGNLYAVNKANGSQAWTTRVHTIVHGEAIVRDGQYLYLACTNKKVYKVSAADGSIAWEYQSPSVFYSTPLVFGDYVFVGGDDFNLYCINKSTGQKLWEFSYGARIHSTQPIALNNSVFAFSESEGKARAIDISSQQEIWQADVGPALHSMYIIGESLFIATKKMEDGTGLVTSLNVNNGQQNWQKEFTVSGMSLRLNTDSNYLYLTGTEDMVSILDISNGNTLGVIEGNGATDLPVVINGEEYYAVNNANGYLKKLFIDEIEGFIQ